MKTVVMERTFDYRPRSGVVVVYVARRRYRRVPEAAARAIVAAGAGKAFATATEPERYSEVSRK